jgi:hypothetical protein
MADFAGAAKISCGHGNMEVTGTKADQVKAGVAVKI